MNFSFVSQRLHHRRVKPPWQGVTTRQSLPSVNAGQGPASPVALLILRWITLLTLARSNLLTFTTCTHGSLPPKALALALTEVQRVKLAFSSI